MFDQPRSGLVSRRRALAAAGMLAVSPALARVSSAAAPATPSPVVANSDPNAPWSFVDDRGKTIALDHRPANIVAQTTAAAALWDCGIYAVGIYGPSRGADGTPDFQAGNIDLDAVTVLGDFAELDIEKLATLNPDLYVDMCYGDDFLWYLTGDARTQVEALIPTMGISMAKQPITHSIERFEELAVSLGADLTNAEYLKIKTAARDAADAFADAVAAKPGLKVLVISPASDQVYVASPEMMTDLAYFKSLGLDIVTPDLPADTAETVYFFASISWEQLGNYPADLILIDARDPSVPDLLAGQAIWNQLPAVQAGQTGPWRASQQYSWLGLNEVLTELTPIVSAAQANIV